MASHRNSAGMKTGTQISARGHNRVDSGVVRMERTEEERTKYPDRINLDRKGLHGIPLLADEPGLRLLSLQHNFIKRIHNLQLISRLVFLDLYHNRLDHISELEPLTNLRVLMLGKNRIRRIEGMTNCTRLSVLDLHGNRIGNIVGLEVLTELKVLNLAGNLIRKISGLESLESIEELNLRRNRIRNTMGLESVPSLTKLYMSNNEIQGLGSLEQIETLTSLETLQMEGNPVWSNPNYSCKLVAALPSLTKLDQQDVTQDMKISADKWKQSLQVKQLDPEEVKEKQEEKNKLELVKRLEQKNASITNAMQRWRFLKSKMIETEAPNKQEEEEKPVVDEQEDKNAEENTEEFGISVSVKNEKSGKISPDAKSEVEIKMDVPAFPDNLKPSSARYRPRRLSGAAQRQARKSVPRSSSACSNISGFSRVSGSDSESTTGRSALTAPPIPIKDIAMKLKFPGLERRKFALPQKYETISQHGSPTNITSRKGSHHELDIEKQKIGYFTVRPKSEVNASSSACQSEDEYSEEFISDSSDSTSSSDSSDDEKLNRPVYNNHTGKRLQEKRHLPRGRDMSRHVASSRSSSQLSDDRGQVRQWVNKQTTKTGFLFKKRRDSDLTGRTCEQGEDYLIELDGDTLSVYGSPSLQFIERSWNKQRAEKATTAQFHYISYDELVPLLPKFRENFPNIEHFEFSETNIRTMNQINALALVQGITSLTINSTGNPIYSKAWRQYAIYRLEHWGLLYINNKGVTDDEILLANETYGSLGELAIMTLPKTKLLSLIRRLELGEISREINATEDFLATIKDANIKEIIAKESLEYDPAKSVTLAKDRSALRSMIDLGHSVFHKFGRLEDEWKCILPIVVHRILTQYQDIHSYKKEELTKLEMSIISK